MDTIEGVPEVSSQSLKNLGDKSYDRRKAAAQEITTAVTKLFVVCMVFPSFAERRSCGQGQEGDYQTAVGLS